MQERTILRFSSLALNLAQQKHLEQAFINSVTQVRSLGNHIWVRARGAV